MLNQSLNRTVFYSAWLILTVFLLLEWLGLSLRNGWEFVPFVVSMLFLGLPHGAIDHLVPYRLQQSSVTIRSLILFLVGYLLIAGFYGVFWWLTTAASAIFFILLTWFHWGQGELYIVEKFISPRKRSAGRSLLIVLVRGGLPMLVPLFAFPDVYIQFVNQMIGVVSSGALISIPTNSLPAWLLPIQLGYATVTAAYILLEGVDAIRQKQVKGWLVDTAEIGLLWLFFSTINPILAVGVYFCVWHSVRHITRLMLIEPASRIDLENGRIGAAFYRFFVESAPLTVVSLLILVGLYFLVGSIQLSLQELIALYLVLISMLTLPHTLVVCWMDYRQSVWALRF